MGLTGSGSAGLRALQARIDVANIRGVLPKVAQRMGAAAVKQLADEFRESRDPYGKPWAPVTRMRTRDQRARAKRAAKGKKVRGDKPLVDTGRMRASVTAQPTGTAVRVSIGGAAVYKEKHGSAGYAAFHQYGTKHIKQRQMLPMENTGGLGPKWGPAFEKEATAVVMRTIGRK